MIKNPDNDNTETDDLQAYLDEQSQQHTIDNHMIEMVIDDLLKGTVELPNELTGQDVLAMSRYEQIQILEVLLHEGKLDDVDGQLLADIRYVVHEVDRQGFFAGATLVLT